METESNILRSPALIRQTISELRDKGEYSPPARHVQQTAGQPFKRYVTSPLREYVINPREIALGHGNRSGA
jgi:hypothetical protein